MFANKLCATASEKSRNLFWKITQPILYIFSEIHRNREFYRTNDVRPPFTYASLIRQVSSLWSPIFWLLQKSIIYYVLPRGVLYSLSFFRKQQVKNLIFNEKFPLMFLGRDWISRASADFARDLQLVHLHFCILQKECGKLEGTGFNQIQLLILWYLYAR